MPTYDFKCPVCSNLKTLSAAYSDDLHAPSCDQCLLVMERVWSANPIHFKGEGWGHQ